VAGGQSLSDFLNSGSFKNTAMKTLKLLSIIALIGLASCESMFPFGNGVKKKDIVGEWTPVQYEIDGVVSEPTAEQRNDYIHFKENETFVCVEKTKTVEGTWFFMQMNNTVNVMTEEDSENCIPWTVETATDTELVYTLTTENGENQKVWLVK
jgi:predicted transport protein